MFVTVENHKSEHECIQADTLKFGDAFVRYGDELDIKNVLVAVCVYSEDDNDIFFVPLVPKTTNMVLPEYGDVRHDHYIDSSTQVVPVKVVVAEVVKNV
ncbi:hypothetical protein KNV09_gp101 [Vibrio phage Athena]|uniref:Uncharacterized protein n=5 Tax=Thalassavirus TaxID=2948922 RepID=A0A6M9Z2I0_9CAUD|nr:aceytl CoA [Vibrio phage Achelous]YP_010105795.1 hypothetical protein KNU88_gp009 [Vibrio phage Chester]YP_010105971.1 hypothetical protein KNU88_gp101 [Vibrio phage Chester]YP_010108052.1 hypothetical protein KNV06_gp007 [Vibrio phage AG74]YP_010108229.1 hypothetical protein KNV06_gp100 [Vibrio phage AG74]YP_010108633.1 hypothetical protein KNV09_gp008 [Vibrio phage Athena]YP_010108809.1 hypothetical protein KNV09_gp101 [Vibrio phage Athena]YP_010114179.1 hypothetical protein KNV71_gp009